LEVLRFGHPEYVPCSETIPIKQIGFFGVNPEDNRPPRAKTWTDLWQVRHEQMIDGVMPFPVYHPLEHLENWEDYTWPDPHDQELYRQAKRAIADIPKRNEIILAGSHRSTLLERSWKLVGMENLFTMMVMEPDRVKWLLRHIMDFQLGVAEEYVKLGIELAQLGDDFGTQQGLLLSPRFFKKFFKPEYERIIDFYKSRNILISFHSCGCIEELVDEFSDLGIDILNPVQAEANNLKLLREKTMGKITLQGAVSTRTLMQGTPGDVVREVKERILTLGQRGGYICGPDQHLPFPADNIKALIEAVEKYGVYPLKVV